MKTNYKKFLLGVAIMVSTPSIGQVANYLFAQSNGTYVPITGGTVIATATSAAAPGNLANMVWNLPSGTFPFPFTFNGVAYTGCDISCSGYITFGTVAPTGGSPISAATAYDGAVAAWGRTSNGVFNIGTVAPFYTSELRVEVIGVAPNRTIVIQYDKWRYSSGTTTTTWLHDYQIRLHETTNIVEIMYGSGYMAGGSLTTSGFNCQVGLRGLTNADFNNRSSFGLFDQSTAGTANNASQVIGVTSGNGIFMPPTGLTYQWKPRCSGTPITPTVTATSTLICEGDTLNFNATGETPYFDMGYQWQISTIPSGPYSNATGLSPTNFSPYQEVGTPGIFYYVLVSTCSNVPSTSISNEIMVDVRPLPIIDILSSPALNTSVTPIETCFGETYTLIATGALTYSWFGGPASDTYVVQPSGNPSYMVTGTSIDGCVATRTLDILVNPLPVLSTLASPNAICPGKSVVVGVTGNAATYTWVAENNNSFLITVTPTITTTYSVIGTALTGCTIMATQEVTVHTVAPLIAATSASTSPICKGEPLNLFANGANTYTWSAPGTYTFGQNVTVFPQITTTFVVTGLDINGCERQASVVQLVSQCLGLNEAEGTLNALSIYPNPNNGVFTLELNNGAAKTIDVMDITGKTVLSTTTNDDKAELNINALANGVYYLRVQSNNAVQVLKLVKQ